MGYGDEIMFSGQARVAQLTDRRKVRATYNGKVRRWNQWNTVWSWNPRIAQEHEQGDFQLLPARDENNMRPYHVAKTEKHWFYREDFRAEVGEIYLTDGEKRFGDAYRGRIILEPHIKSGASVNKQWGWVKWNKLARILNREGLRVAQLGAASTVTLDGVELIQTPNFRLACSVLRGSLGVVLPEGGTHHAAAAFAVKGVVLFGGFTPIGLTGYAVHVNLGAEFGDACGSRLSCKHCAQWMERITPEEVRKSLMEKLI